LLLLHTSSALANIFPEVRIDAVKVLGVVMGSCTREDLEGEVGGRMREGLMGVLGLGGGWVEPAGTSGGAQGGSSSGSTGGTTTLGPAVCSFPFLSSLFSEGSRTDRHYASLFFLRQS
jgi:hypothetical protein